LCSGRLKLAQKLCDELGVLASPVTGVDMEIKTEASLRHARTLLAAKQFREVFSHPLCSMQYALKISIIQKIMVFLKV
jgi:anaphase-promoting complex subunit 5